MNAEQNLAVEIIKSGHNLILTGQAGSGKTYTIQHACKELNEMNTEYTLTCSTGIATCAYQGMKAVTLHKWCGILDGRYSNDELLHLMNTDERYTEIKQRIIKTECLIIDEVSMISSKTFNQVEFILRNTKNNNLNFGGIQMVLCGDFFQLPPVPNELYGDQGKHCFNTTFFDQVFPHKVNLHVIYRQADQDLISAINELAQGGISDATKAIIQSLSRPLPNTVNVEDVIYLFCRNADADIHNYKVITDRPGNLVTFTAEDNGDTYYLSKMLAPKHLGLKIGVKVILLTNLSDDLVNGKMGIVHSIAGDLLHVVFNINGKDIICPIRKFTFTTYDPVSKSTISKRVQFPLKPAYGLTIHKSQGMSLNHVVVNCQNCSIPGQIGVAVGRATSVDGLQIVNFKSVYVCEHQQSVYAYYKSCSVGYLNPDKSCCHGKPCIGNVGPDKEDDITGGGDGDDDDDDDEPQGGTGQSTENSDSDFSDVEYDIFHIANIDADCDKVKEILEEIAVKYRDTPLESIVSETVKHIMKKPKEFLSFYDNQYKTVDSINLGRGMPKDINDYYLAFNKHVSSEIYTSSVENLRVLYNADLEHFHRFMTDVMVTIRISVLRKHQHVEVDNPPLLHVIDANTELTGSGRGKVRYVGGYVVAKLKYRNSKRLSLNLFAPGRQKETDFYLLRQKFLEQLSAPEKELIETSTDKESLEETRRKQNVRGSLCNITDRTFHFFSKLEVEIRKLCTSHTLKTFRGEMYTYVQSSLLGRLELKREFVELFHSDHHGDIPDSNTCTCQICNVMDDLFQQVVKLFVKVNIAQFRRNFLHSLQVRKSKALRQRVMNRVKVKEKTFNINFLLEDTSVGKEASHHRLKSEMLNMDRFVQIFTKPQIIQIAKAYGVAFNSSVKKSSMLHTLSEKLQGTEVMPYPKELGKPTGDESNDLASADTPSTSTGRTTSSGRTSTCTLAATSSSSTKVARKKSVSDVNQQPAVSCTGKRKGKGRQKGKSKAQKKKIEIDAETCGVCGNSEGEAEEWIECDTCVTWYHRSCVNISDELWERYTTEDQSFICPECD